MFGTKQKEGKPPPFKTEIGLGTRLHIPLVIPVKSDGPFPFLPSRKILIFQSIERCPFTVESVRTIDDGEIKLGKINLV